MWFRNNVARTFHPFSLEVDKLNHTNHSWNPNVTFSQPKIWMRFDFLGFSKILSRHDVAWGLSTFWENSEPKNLPMKIGITSHDKFSETFWPNLRKGFKSLKTFQVSASYSEISMKNVQGKWNLYQSSRLRIPIVLATSSKIFRRLFRSFQKPVSTLNDEGRRFQFISKK